MVIADLTVAQPTFLGKVGEVEDAVEELERSFWMTCFQRNSQWC